MTDTERAPSAGTILGERYRLERELGAGGMGTVWEAVQLDLGRRVAVKLLHAKHAGDMELRERFFREARALAALGQPGIVTILDFAPEAEPPYLVMERLVGESLRARLARERKLSIAEAVRVARAVLASLAAAHDAGLVHRDVKPENVFLCSEPPRLVKLVDFGVAKSRKAAPLTAEGLVVGTTAYMSPEQLRGEAVGARTDVYAVGVLLFECIAGRRPLRGDDRTALVQAVLGDSPPLLSDLDASVPAALAGLVDRALRKSAGARFGDARAFRDALAPFEAMDAPEVEQATATRGPRRAGSAPPAPEAAKDSESEPPLELAPTLLVKGQTRTAAPISERPPRGSALGLVLVAALLLAGGVLAFQLMR